MGTRRWEGSRALARLNPTSKSHTHTHTHTQENHPQREAAITAVVLASLWADDDDHGPTSMTHSCNPLKPFLAQSKLLQTSDRANTPSDPNWAARAVNPVLISWVWGGGQGTVRRFSFKDLNASCANSDIEMTLCRDEWAPKDVGHTWPGVKGKSVGRTKNTGNNKIDFSLCLNNNFSCALACY